MIVKCLRVSLLFSSDYAVYISIRTTTVVRTSSACFRRLIHRPRSWASSRRCPPAPWTCRDGRLLPSSGVHKSNQGIFGVMRIWAFLSRFNLDKYYWWQGSHLPRPLFSHTTKLACYGGCFALSCFLNSVSFFGTDKMEITQDWAPRGTHGQSIGDNFRSFDDHTHSKDNPGSTISAPVELIAFGVSPSGYPFLREHRLLSSLNIWLPKPAHHLAPGKAGEKLRIQQFSEKLHLPHLFQSTCFR